LLNRADIPDAEDPAEAEQRHRIQRKPSPEGAAPENEHYSFSGNDLWSRLLGGHHSVHGTSAHSTHSDGGSFSGGDGGGGGGDSGGGGDGGSGD
jgi:hypothetical protein